MLHQAGFDEWTTFNYYVFLLVGENHRILVDCGIDDLEPFNAVLRRALGERGMARPERPRDPVLTLLAERGVEPEDIDAIALTHLHVDHVANVHLFPRAQYLVSAEGWRRHLELERAAPQMVPDPIFPRRAIDHLRDAGDRLVLVDDGPAPLPGLEVRYVGGHTADCAAWIVRTGAGRVVLPSDTIWTYRNLEDDHPVGALVDLRQCYEAMAWVRTAGAIVIPPHDPDVLRRHPDGISGKSPTNR